jgi:uncharacterized protein (TIGR03435 family)
MVPLRGLSLSTCLIAIAPLRAQSPVARPSFDSFEVATIKPAPDDGNRGRFLRMQTANQFVARNYTLRVLISAAYNLNPKAIAGGPAWVDSDRYDIVARTPGGVRPNMDEQLAMLRNLLADRFNLTLHREKKEMPIYVLTIAKNGPKMRESQPVENPEGPPPLVFVLAPEVVKVPARSATTTEFTYILQRSAFDRPVLDRTGLTARYDFDLEFAPDESLFGGLLKSPVDSTRPGIFAAIQEQLGLKLEATRGPVDSIVIDKIERPSEN